MAQKKRTQPSPPRSARQPRAVAEATAVPHRLRRQKELFVERLRGTRVGRLFDGLPDRCEHALDRALDRLGLVRKSKLAGTRSTASAQPA